MRTVSHEAIAQAEYDLYRAGFTWRTANGGVHLQVVDAGEVVADYWPTTGKVIFRKVKGYDRTKLYDAIRQK